MADIADAQQSEVTRITGRDESFVADVVQEDGENKLLVKASNVPQPIGNLFFDYAADGSNVDMNVDGSSTPAIYEILAHPTLDKVIGSLVFEAFDGGIKIDNFLGQNDELTNGITIEVKSEDQIFTFLPIKNTQEFDSLFSFGDGRSFALTFASGNDSMVARFGSSTPFVLKPVGTYTIDDYIKVTINDDIDSISRLRFLAVGQLD
jgi:hypothetical protein